MRVRTRTNASPRKLVFWLLFVAFIIGLNVLESFFDNGFPDYMVLLIPVFLFAMIIYSIREKFQTTSSSSATKSLPLPGRCPKCHNQVEQGKSVCSNCGWYLK